MGIRMSGVGLEGLPAPLYERVLNLLRFEVAVASFGNAGASFKRRDSFWQNRDKGAQFGERIHS
jgi:hypothetical protein